MARVNKKNKKPVWREWLEAILIAVLVVWAVKTFLFEAYTIPTTSMEKTLMAGDYLVVEKLTYGARLPITPLSIPLVGKTSHWIPLEKTFSDIITLPYLRMPGVRSIKKNDVIVFNYPIEHSFPIDKRTNYIKRCVAEPGDTLAIKKGELYINDELQEMPEHGQLNYILQFDNMDAYQLFMKKEEIADGGLMRKNVAKIPLTQQQYNFYKDSLPVDRRLQPHYTYEDYLFPGTEEYKWNIDHYGPLVVPKKGEAVELNLKNLPFYYEIISTFEKNDLKLIDGKIYINEKEINTYTFKMNYYFALGDNRYYSADSRFWGFIPEDHISGKAALVIFSLKNGEGFFDNIRWERWFKKIK